MNQKRTSIHAQTDDGTVVKVSIFSDGVNETGPDDVTIKVNNKTATVITYSVTDEGEP